MIDTVLQVLEKDPARRHASAAAVADNLDRSVRGEPIDAGPVANDASNAKKRFHIQRLVHLRKSV
jgi:hypothetical protein